MRSSTARKRRSLTSIPARRRLPMLTACAALSLLTACREQVVVLKPIAPPPVAPALLADVKAPRCSLKPAEAYPPPDLEAERKCFAVAESAARNRHNSLASAVRVREAAIAKAVQEARQGQ